jgi:hypothetical protein
MMDKMESGLKKENYWIETDDKGREVVRMDSFFTPEFEEVMTKLKKKTDGMVKVFAIFSPLFIAIGVIALYIWYFYYFDKYVLIINGIGVIIIGSLMGHFVIKQHFKIGKEFQEDPEALEKREGFNKASKLHDNYRKMEWFKRRIKKMCPRCRRGPYEYYGVDDELLWHHFDDNGKLIKEKPECKCGSNDNLLYIAFDMEGEILAIIDSESLDHCSECGVSKVLWSEIVPAREGVDKWDRIPTYLQLPGEKLYLIFEIMAMCRKCFDRTGLKVGDDLFKYLDSIYGEEDDVERKKSVRKRVIL